MPDMDDFEVLPKYWSTSIKTIGTLMVVVGQVSRIKYEPSICNLLHIRTNRLKLDKSFRKLLNDSAYERSYIFNEAVG